MTRGRAFVLRGWMTWASVGAVLSVATLTWLGYRAVVEWQHSADVIDQRTADASADLLLTAVTRDMRAVQRTVLSTLQVGDASGPAALDLNAVASAFARYPYPDAFFVARITPQQPIISFYARTTRQPAWLPAASVDTPFPVVTVADSRIANQLLERIARDRHRRKPFSVFEARLGRARCQVVALLTYVDERGSVSIDVRGFIVDLEWVRRNYFQDLTSQIARMRVANPDLRLAIVDASGAVRAGAATAARTVSARRSFPLLFFDPAIVELDRPEDLATEWWNADATLTGRRSDAVRRGAWASLVIVSVSALALAASLGLSATALQARFRLTEARSDFVSAVTHELKTPTATIQTISESFVRRPHIDEATRRDYGRILLDETRRLARLIDNLLAHSRISDIAETYAFEAIAPHHLIERSLRDFRLRLEMDGFDLRTDVPPGLPCIRADPTAAALALSNIIDNAIRYSDERRWLAIRARQVDRDEVSIEIADGGIGIPSDEVGKVLEKFFRGRGAVSGGTGLGLTIADRIVKDHDGRLTMVSAVGVGTTVTVVFGIARVQRRDADSDR